MPCKWASKPSVAKRSDGSTWTTIRCAIIRASGLIKGSLPEAYCIGCDATDKDDADLTRYPKLRERAIFLLRHTCRFGELPKYDWNVDMKAAFALYRQLAGNAAARKLLPDMLIKQGSVKEVDGGIDPEVLAARFDEIAKAEGMEDVLEGMIGVESATR